MVAGDELIISHRHRFIFIKTRKTAGTSVEIFLAQHCGPDDIVTPIAESGHPDRGHRGFFDPLPEIRAGLPLLRTLHRVVTRRRFHNHISAASVRARAGRRIWDDYFTFCVERDPWDKTLSDYAWVKARKPDAETLTFDDYLRHRPLMVDHPAYTEPGEPGRLMVDAVLQYGDLNGELARTLPMLGIPFEPPLPAAAKANIRKDRRPYREVYTDDQRTRVAQAFAREIDLFGYRFDEGPTSDLPGR